jgi:hypothetical protein
MKEEYLIQLEKLWNLKGYEKVNPDCSNIRGFEIIDGQITPIFIENDPEIDL